jgi:hypothetical protein
MANAASEQFTRVEWDGSENGNCDFCVAAGEAISAKGDDGLVRL